MSYEIINENGGKPENSQSLCLCDRDKCYSLCNTILLLFSLLLGNTTHSSADCQLQERGSDYPGIF